MTRRDIDPSTVFFALGAWYVNAFCHRAVAERVFRVDRIRDVQPTGVRFDPPESDTEVPARVFHPRATDPRVTLRLRPEAAWVAEHYPTEAVTERADGTLDVELVVSEDAFLERLLLRLGPDVTVLAPPPRRGAAAAAARRVLARYRDTTSPTRDP
jgi:proteasome accessory factor C